MQGEGKGRRTVERVRYALVSRGVNKWREVTMREDRGGRKRRTREKFAEGVRDAVREVGTRWRGDE